jgi:hypothetical protein
MRAVWSFWSKAYTRFAASIWGSDANHLLAWALSFERARQHYPETMLVTDDAGARVLVDGLGLEFTSVSLALNQLDDIDPQWWSVGKFVAVLQQERPFVHLDSDVFLWSALPDRVVRAPVFAQNPERFRPGFDWYEPEAFESALDARTGAWLPPEWRWPPGARTPPRGECCGVVGGTDLALIRDWADTGLRILRHEANRAALAGLADRHRLVITLEQYLLATMVEHRGAPIAYLFKDWTDATTPGRAAALGFTHLISDTKRGFGVRRRLARRLLADHPERYAQVRATLDQQRLASGRPGHAHHEVITTSTA